MVNGQGIKKIGFVEGKSMTIKIDFGHPYFDKNEILELSLDDLNCFYADANEVNQLNLFFILEASLHRLQNEKEMQATARCAFLMAYYLFIALTPPASCELAEFYIDKALEWNETPEYRQWKENIDDGN